MEIERLHLIADAPLAAAGLIRFCEYCLEREGLLIPQGLGNLFASIVSDILEAETVVLIEVRDSGHRIAGDYAIEGARCAKEELAEALIEPAARESIFARDGIWWYWRQAQSQAPLFQALAELDSYLVASVPKTEGMADAPGWRVLAVNSQDRRPAQKPSDTPEPPFKHSSKRLSLAFEAWTAGRAGMEKLQREAWKLWRGIREGWQQLIELFLCVVDIADPCTAGHSERVQHLALKIAKRFAPELSRYELAALELVAAAHDLGKVGVESVVLNKPNQPTAGERAMLAVHCELGRRILCNLPHMERNGLAVYYHHRWYDGSAGPGLAEREEIPLLARIVSVADSFDAMVSVRAYQPIPKTFAEALTELRGKRGTQFDPTAVEALIAAIEAGQIDREKVKEHEVAQAVALVREATLGFAPDRRLLSEIRGT